MKLPGTLEQRFGVLTERFRLIPKTGVMCLENAGISVEYVFDNALQCIQLRLEPNDVQFLRQNKCADFAFLLARDEAEFEAHVIEYKSSVGADEWLHIQGQFEGAMVRLLAVAGVLGVRIRGALFYTAFRKDKLSRDTSADMVTMKSPLGPNDDRRAEARRSWERGTFRMSNFDAEVQHHRIQVNQDGRAVAACRMCTHVDIDAPQWRFEPTSG